MRAHHRALAIAAVVLTAATGAFAQAEDTSTLRRRGDVFQYGPLNAGPSSSITNPLSGGVNPLNRNTAAPRSNVVTPVPEPSQWAMMLAGLALVGFIVRRNSKRQ